MNNVSTQNCVFGSILLDVLGKLSDEEERELITRESSSKKCHDIKPSAKDGKEELLRIIYVISPHIVDFQQQKWLKLNRLPSLKSYPSSASWLSNSQQLFVFTSLTLKVSWSSWRCSCLLPVYSLPRVLSLEHTWTDHWSLPCHPVTLLVWRYWLDLGGT